MNLKNIDPRIQNIIGNRYGKLTVVRYTGDRTKSRSSKWECKCDCGNTTIASSGDLKAWHVKSCGCLLVSSHKKYNQYDLTGEYGIGIFSNTDQEFYFDLEDYDRIKDYCWKNSNGYVHTSVRNNEKNKALIMHRYLLDVNDPKIIVDHKNGNPADNRKSNLRIATSSENSINKYKNKNNTTGFKGVSRNGNGYVARIKKDGKTICLGTYATPEESAEVRKQKEIELFGEFSVYNSRV